MDSVVSSSSFVKQTPSRRSPSSIHPKDLWSVSRHGSVSEVDLALLLLKKNGGNVDTRNSCGVTPLHIAVWRNHVPIVKRLLAAGADPDARDGESGWSSLHRALHFGHLAVASVLIQAGASLAVEDSKFRSPIDLLSGPVLQVVGNNLDSVGEVGQTISLNWQCTHPKLPVKVDALNDSHVKIISASKFHSIAVGSNGELYTWGFGRGGRLGHPEFDVHSGQAAVITPRLVSSGLGTRRVKAVEAAKHHTVIATESGEVFTWGSNREGQLGYTSVDTQPTPRRVSFLKARIVAVAAANKHTAVVAESGEVFTWGCNKDGQLGYGTSNSASNYTPRLVEYLKGKSFRGVSASKYHTIALSSDGEVFTWGHRLVNPRRVTVCRSLKKINPALLKFHRKERLHIISIAAGMTHSSALADDGALFYWASSDPDLRCEQVQSLCGKNIVSISAGKYWTTAVTTTGDVYMWNGKNCEGGTPVVTRLPGIKHATSACVGETHLLAVCALYHPAYLHSSDSIHQPSSLKGDDEIDELDEGLLFTDMLPYASEPVMQTKDESYKPVPTLKSLSEKVAAEFLVEPRNAIQLLEIADSLEAKDLRKHCEDLVIQNLDYIFMVSAASIASASLEVLAKLEKSLDARSSEPWSYRRLPTPTATFPVVIYSEENGDNEVGNPMPRDNKKHELKEDGCINGDGFLQRDCIIDQAVSKQVRAFRKKLQQIEMLESKQHSGHVLDDQQKAKLQTRSALELALAELGISLETEPEHSLSPLSDAKGNKKPDGSRKQRKKKKQMATQPENIFTNNEQHEMKSSFEGFPVDKSSISKPKEGVAVELNSERKMAGDCSVINPNATHETGSNKTVRQISAKKKNKKGGLSMFLSGDLDEMMPKNIPTPKPKTEGPAWGGAKIAKGSTSLRDIQKEQSKIEETYTKPKEYLEEAVEVTNGQVRLSLFLPRAASAPIAVKPSQGLPVSEGDKGAPPWSSSGTSPVLHRQSLRDIQMQQEKKHQSTSHSPSAKTPGFSIAPVGSPSESGGPGPSRWFKPETEAPSSIRSIQIEEKAMKDLKRFYSSVRLVKAQPQPL
ncbi:hypothetical protein HPP92_028052 [Vanilla planifolia]|uniref:RCC1-like domain-containing protein n=1 Tax=Vanilla planifolia TaxID=51239 RepID=A0A835P6S4_VANPL|nr:hypothetical protein HPP92_028052 [Vanilla planifolia]